MERSWFLCHFVTPPFRGSHHICQAKHKPSISVAPHPINYQSAAPFHKAPQLDRLSLSPTRKMCPRCSTVTESSTICMPTTSRLTLTHFSDVPTARATLQSCITDVGDWCSSRRLQLNETKTELIWFGSKKSLGKVPESELNLTVGSNIIQPVKSVLDLGVQLDTELLMKTHVSKVASTSRRSGSRSSVGFCVHTFPAGLL